MSSNENPLIDLIQLSQTLCQQPIQGKLAYATRENFLGRIVKGYHPEVTGTCLFTENAAQALCNAQTALTTQGLGLFVYDSYRPLRAVRDFLTWIKEPVSDAYELERKRIHYPHLEKGELANLGYLALEVSNHCFGDTVDLTLIDLSTGQLLDMGACFDYFDEISHTTATAKQIGETAYKNRQILSDAMQQAGFMTYEKEFWHFTFQQRDIQTPLDFEITNLILGDFNF